MAIEPFVIAVPDEAIVDLRERLARTRWPSEVVGSDWRYGTDLTYLQELCAYWQREFDWRAREAALNAMPQFRAAVDGYGVHFVSAEGRGPDPLPLLFTHGWPGSIVEVAKIIGPLTDPASYGGDPADAFHVVAPSIPGYGFSEIPSEPGYGPRRTADLWDELMRVLGFDRYGVQGGDWGAYLSGYLAYLFPERVVGSHTNATFIQPPPDEREPRSAAERAYLEGAAGWRENDAGYHHIQRTRPQTLSYGLTDSPAGQAAWIVEKWRSNSDCGGEIERRFSKDEILTNVAIYWFSGTANSSSRFYYEAVHEAGWEWLGGRVEVPCGFANFAAELPHLCAPRSWVERGCNVTHWSTFDRGGHYPAMEEPALLVEDIRTFFRPLR